MTVSETGREQRRVDGIVLLDKARGATSNKALQQVKYLFAAAKAGHTGSLDPLATGMLPICLGEATKMSTFLLDAAKTYRVTGRLGIATDTGDADGRVVSRAEVPSVDAAAFCCVLEGFRGEIEQTPPMYSALKHRGQPLYKLARKGVEVERAPRVVRIHALELEAWDGQRFTCRVGCSKGTYIRSLVMDIAAALGSVGHVEALRRLEVEPFSADDMLSLQALAQRRDAGMDALDATLLACDAALAAWPSVRLGPDSAAKLRQGQRPPAVPDWPVGPVRIYASGGEFLGIGDVDEAGRLVARRLMAY